VSEILRHIRRGRIRGLHSFQDGAAEVVEGEALETSKLVGKELRDVKLPQGTIIGAILRDKEVIIPRGKTIIKPNDRVVLLSELFQTALCFFRIDACVLNYTQ